MRERGRFKRAWAKGNRAALSPVRPRIPQPSRRPTPPTDTTTLKERLISRAARCAPVGSGADGHGAEVLIPLSAGGGADGGDGAARSKALSLRLASKSRLPCPAPLCPSLKTSRHAGRRQVRAAAGRARGAGRAQGKQGRKRRAAADWRQGAFQSSTADANEQSHGSASLRPRFGGAREIWP